MNKPERLNGMSAYLIGAMDRVPDGGVGWRQVVKKRLQGEFGVVVYDPTNKPSDMGKEEVELREARKKWFSHEMYQEIAEDVKIIRAVDLRMVDKADFMVVHLDISVHACGSYEEIFLANREKKPILIWVEQGKQKCPAWLFGVIPHQMIFSSLDDLMGYLMRVDEDETIDTYKRWLFFHKGF